MNVFSHCSFSNSTICALHRLQRNTIWQFSRLKISPDGHYDRMEVTCSALQDHRIIVRTKILSDWMFCDRKGSEKISRDDLAEETDVSFAGQIVKTDYVSQAFPWKLHTPCGLYSIKWPVIRRPSWTTGLDIFNMFLGCFWTVSTGQVGKAIHDA